MNAAEIARALGGHRHGQQWRCRCPAHNDHDPSLDVRDTVGGVLVHCKVGCAQREVIDALIARGLWEQRGLALTDRERLEAEQARRIRLEHAAKEKADADERMRLHALQLFAAANDPRLSDGDLYLRQRGLHLPDEAATVVRFHPECPRGAERVPALVVLMRNVVTGKRQAVQRIYIRPDFTKDKCEASPNGTRTLGVAKGAAMMISSWDTTFAECLAFCPVLYVTEGFETALAMLGRGYAPVWALGSTATLRDLPVLFGVAHLVICADHDHPKERNGATVQPGLDAARECARRWNASDHQKATIWMPTEAGKDFADDPSF